MALNGLFCADVPLRNYSLTHCRLDEGLGPKHCVALVLQSSSTRLPPLPTRVASHGKQDALR